MNGRGSIGALLALALFVGCGGGDAAGEGCFGMLDEVGVGCPSTFDGTSFDLPPCVAEERNVVVHCQDLILLTHEAAPSYRFCYYDSTSHALVGAERGTGVGTYCGGVSFTEAAGRTAPGCRDESLTLGRVCAAQTSSNGS